MPAASLAVVVASISRAIIIYLSIDYNDSNLLSRYIARIRFSHLSSSFFLDLNNNSYYCTFSTYTKQGLTPAE